MKEQILKLFILIIVLFLMNINSLQHNRKRILETGDLMIGALIPVHEQPNDTDQTSVKRKCGTIRDQYGVQRVEALLYLLDKINNKSSINILPGIKLGLEIRDECWDASIALEETIDFIKDSISSSKETTDIEKILPNFEPRTIYKNKSYEVVEVNTFGSSNCMPQVLKKSNGQNRILAVIGPSGSTVAITVQNLLQLFDIPQVGFSATSADLSNKKMYKTFLRVVPSDYLQVRAMVDIVTRMNWTYLFAVYTDGSYGQAGMEAFRNETVYLDICLAEYEKIKEYATNNDYELLIRKLNRTENARVIVCFCYGETVRGLLGAIHRLKLKGRFLILGSDGWSDRIDVARGYYDEAFGSLSVKAYSPVVKEFDNYFIGLNPSNNLRNVWFEEYWQERFKCHLIDDYKKKFPIPCKRKCPKGFEYFADGCYYISEERKNWTDALNDCKSRHFEAGLIDFSDKLKLRNLIAYMVDNNDVRRGAFHGQLDSKFGGKLVIGLDYRPDMTVKECFFKRTVNLFDSSNYSEKCVQIEIEQSSKGNAYCINLDGCSKKLNYVCSYNRQKNLDLNTNRDDTSSDDLVYSDTLQYYQQDPKMSYVMNSFLAIAYGLNKIHEKFCKGVSGLCDEMKNINGSTLLKYIRDTKFIGITNEHIYFNSDGDPGGRYVILNVQKDKNSVDGYVYREVGSWNNEIKLNFSVEKLMFPKSALQFESQCSKPCPFGYVKQIKGGVKCCWSCKKCEDYAFTVDEFLCQECPYGEWPAENSTGCVKLPLDYFKWSDASAIFALFISFIGIILNTFITHIFIKFSHTSIVKSTTKELSFIILAGIYLCYLVTIPLILKPSAITCYLARIFPGFSLSLIYGALLTKTNRISRILSRSKKRILTKKPRFMSITAQIVITIIIITIECTIIFATFVMNPTISEVTYPLRHRPRLQCFNSFLTVLGPIGYDLFLVGLCTLYAVKTRNLPENFNEAKFIGFSMYTTCVIWIAFIPLYFGSDFKVITLCLSTSLSATVILLFLFLPKVYIIIFEPEKNNRSSFATSKDLRIHFGSSNVEEKSSSSNASFVVSLMEKIGVKPKSGNSFRSDTTSTTKTVITSDSSIKKNIKRQSITAQDGKNLEFIANNTQKTERSCQTSHDLLLPMLEKEIKRRKAYGISMFDDSDDLNILLNNINDNYDEKEEKNQKKKVKIGRSLSVLGKFQNYLVPTIEELKANTNLEIQKNKNLLCDIPNENNENQKQNIPFKSSLKKPTISPNLFDKVSSISAKQNSINEILMNEINESLLIPSDSLDKTKKIDENLNNQKQQTKKVNEHKPSPISLPKINESIENESIKSENESTSDDEITIVHNNENDSNKNKSDIDYESSISSSLSNINSIDYFNNDDKKNKVTLIHQNNFDPSSDIEHELTLALEGDDESLEKFKNMITRDDKFVLNWDYVQSSDYI